MTFFVNPYVNNTIYATGGNSVVYQELFDGGGRSMGLFATHTFLSSGTFQVIHGKGIAHMLVVGGGGGGGMDMGGGGGAGGMEALEVNITQPGPNYIAIGGGGAGAPAGGTPGQGSFHQFQISATNGNQSSFIGQTYLVVNGGGYGGSSYFGYTPNYGYGYGDYTVGSAGGASGYSDGATGRNGVADTKPGGVGGAGKSGGTSSGQYRSGGGGGALGAGAGAGAQPNGGAGVQVPYLNSFYFAGGGGGASYSLATGGNGGIGGGGGGAVGTTSGGAGINNGSAGGGGSPNSQTNTPGGNAGANTGGGGGGGSHYNSNNRGGNGGSGIVIVRYPCYRPALVQNGLVLHYDISHASCYPGTGNTVYDLSPTGLNATTTSSIGASGFATALTSNNPTTTATTSILNTDTHTICFSLFISGATTGTWDKIFGYTPAGSDRSPGVWRYPNAQLLHWRYDPGNTGTDLARYIGGDFSTSLGLSGFSDGWAYVCVTKSGSTATAYVNGTRVAVNTVAATKTAGNSTVQLFPAYSNNAAYMRHVHIYNRALSAEEIAANFISVKDQL